MVAVDGGRPTLYAKCMEVRVKERGLFGIGDRGLPTLVGELKQLTIDYAKQETIEPLKGLGRYLMWGLAGSLLLGIGLTLWVVAGLRALQEETGSAFTGHLTWVPYVLTMLGTVLVASLAIYAIFKEKRVSDRRKAQRAEARGEGGA